MRLLRVVTAALVIGSTVAALAEPGSYARRSNRIGGRIMLDISYVAPNGCQAILGIGRGAPAGISVDFRSVPVTVVVGPDPRGCSGKQVLRRTSATFGGIEADLVEFFFISPNGRLLKHVKSAIG